MAILAVIPHNGETMTVQVLDVFDGCGDRRVATVRALSGEPFTAWTHGGWIQSATAHIPACLLRCVAISVELLTPATLATQPAELAG